MKSAGSIPPCRQSQSELIEGQEKSQVNIKLVAPLHPQQIAKRRVFRQVTICSLYIKCEYEGPFTKLGLEYQANHLIRCDVVKDKLFLVKIPESRLKYRIMICRGSHSI